MTRKFMAISAAAVAAGLSLGAGVVRAETPTTEQLMQKIDQLQSKVDQLEAKQTDAVTSKEVDATVERVLKDAEQRSELLQMEGFTAGYTKGRFTIQDAAGNWVLRPMFLFDFRYSSAYRWDGKHGDDLDNQHGYEVSNMKFGFDGVACTNFNYFFLWNTNSSGGGVELEQAWVDYKWNDDFAIKSGQYVNPVFHEQTTAAEYQMAVDRSVTNFLVTGANQAITQAFSVVYDPKDSPFNVEVGIEDGFNSVNTDFTQVDANCGAFARVNWFVNGPRSEYKDFTARGNKSDLLVIGGGLDYTNVGDISVFRHTVDVQWENTGGLSVYAAYLAAYINDGNVDEKNYNWGLLCQVGYMINNDWEAFGRAGYVGFDHNLVSGSTSEDSHYCEFAVGVNWYLCNHNAKVTFDATILPGGSATDIPDLNVLENGNTELVYRSQFQLLL